MARKQVLTMGETMAAFTPGQQGALRYVQEYRMRIAGAESNFAIGLAKLGVPVAWVSRLGQDEFGHYVENMIRAEGVDTSACRYDPEHPTGLMFKEIAAGETAVHYYRQGSAASCMARGELTRRQVENAALVHLTGITPVLSSGCRDAVEEAFDLAQAAGVPVSFDPNIRQKLWKGTDHTAFIRSLALRAQIVLLGRWEAGMLFGTEEAQDVFDILFTQGKARYIALKDGHKGAWVADRKRREKLAPYACVCVEPIGAGDAFNAAFVCGLLEGRDVVTAGRMGNIAGGLATTTVGDIEGYPSRERLERLLAGGEAVYR